MIPILDSEMQFHTPRGIHLGSLSKLIKKQPTRIYARPKTTTKTRISSETVINNQKHNGM